MAFRLYTPAMLAGLLGVELAVVRRWHRRGLIRAASVVHRLPYFDAAEVTTARRLAELSAAGVSPRAMEKQLAALARHFPNVERPLAELSVIVRGKKILVRQGDGLVEPGGQWRFDFETERNEPATELTSAPSAEEPYRPTLDFLDAAAGEAFIVGSQPSRLSELAAELEEEGRLAAASDTYRAAMAAGGPKAEWCFQVAELLYRSGDLNGARERYYMAIELDEEFVEARANLGCVLVETGQHELAVAAFEGALRYHPDYADAHYHLARTLDEQGSPERAEEHWRTFLELAPDSPWADEAHQRLDAAAKRLFE